MELDLNSAIDKLAEKIGVSIAQLKPVADEVIRQYKLEQTTYIILWSVLFFVTFIIAAWLFAKARHYQTLNKDPKAAQIDSDIIGGHPCSLKLFDLSAFL